MSEASRRWTPYNYCYSNPIRFIDPDGMLGKEALPAVMYEFGFAQIASITEGSDLAAKLGLESTVGSNVGNRPPSWEGGYNRETMVWEDIKYQGKTYKVLTRNDIEALLGLTGQAASDKFEEIALAAFH